MNSNVAATRQMGVDGGRDANDMPNIVKALACAGSCAGLFLGSKVNVEHPDRNNLALFTVTAAGGGVGGFLVGYTLHYSLLAIVDGVRMITNCLESPSASSSGTSSNCAQSASVPSNPVSES